MKMEIDETSGKHVDPDMKKTTKLSPEELKEIKGETPQETVQRLLLERELADEAAEAEAAFVQTEPSTTTYPLLEVEILRLENIQLKERILKQEMVQLEVKMGALVERIRHRLEVPGDAEMVFGQNHTVRVTR